MNGTIDILNEYRNKTKSDIVAQTLDILLEKESDPSLSERLVYDLNALVISDLYLANKTHVSYVDALITNAIRRAIYDYKSRHKQTL